MSTARRVGPAEYQALAERRGYLWLGPEVPTTTTPTAWRCPHQHVWSATYHKISSGRGCPTCAHESRRAKQRHGPARYHTLAARRGFRWTGTAAPNVATPTRWTCAAGHSWEACYNSVQQGRGCPHCAGNARITAEDYHAVARAREFEWQGREVVGSQRKTSWRCRGGHTWQAPYASLRAGFGCPFCSGRYPHPPERYETLARARGLEWVGPRVANRAEPTQWRCAAGHEFSATYGAILRGRGCPACARARRGQTRRLGAEAYEGLGRARGFAWLGPLPPLARLPTAWRCDCGHVWRARFHAIRGGTGCPRCQGVCRKTAEEYRALAAERGIRWLGRDAVPVLQKTLWRCERGHRWRTCYSKIQQGRSCSHCDDRVRGVRVSAPQRRLAAVLGGEMNRRVGRVFVDVALRLGEIRVAVEYDSWWFHALRTDRDRARVEALLKRGWRVLRIRSNSRLPDEEQLRTALERIQAGERFVELTLPDWGRGAHRGSIPVADPGDPYGRDGARRG